MPETDIVANVHLIKDLMFRRYLVFIRFLLKSYFCKKCSLFDKISSVFYSAKSDRIYYNVLLCTRCRILFDYIEKYILIGTPI